MTCHDLTLYNSLGMLLKSWRKEHNVTQKALAEIINSTEREIRRWEAGTHPVTFPNLNDISEYTGIPMEVLVLLNNGRPMYYSLRKRRYAHSASDSKDFYTNSIFPNIIDDNGIIGQCAPIKRNKEVDAILQYDHSIYPTDNPLKAQTIIQATKFLPELNLFLRDCWGQYSGHSVCLPLNKQIYLKIRDQKIKEGDLEISDLSFDKYDVYVYYFYSIYVSCRCMGYQLLREVLQGLNKQHYNIETRIAGYAVTSEGIELCQKIGMEEVFKSEIEYRDLNTEMIPALYEGFLGNLLSRQKK